LVPQGWLAIFLPKLDFIEYKDLREQTIFHLKNENFILEDYLQYLLYAIPHIGTYSTRGVNKLVLLDLARKLGIDIPETYIVSERSLLDDSEKLITKSISEIFTPNTKNGRYITYTEALKRKPRTSKFFPSLFQTHIDKEADIRIFILRDKVCSMAIRSQEHAQTMVDFRKYLSVNSNRHFPFKLPSALEQKLIELLKKARLETASIDMILTKDGRFIFLEANPIGQFGMTSKPCNAYLEREIALTLMELSKQRPYERI
jgi:ATP-GRASP peptide maturase of grasp-with-spasm system